MVLFEKPFLESGAWLVWRKGRLMALVKCKALYFQALGYIFSS